MDPDVAWKRIKSAVEAINDLMGPFNVSRATETLERLEQLGDDLSEATSALQEWLSRGGFLPEEMAQWLAVS